MKSLLFFLFLCIATLLYAQPGMLDPSFGNKGIFIDPTVSYVGERAMIVTRDGRILVGTGGPYKGFDFTFRIDAYLPDGSRDLSFGENGSAYVLFPDMKVPQDNATIGSLALLPDGRILAQGGRYNLIFYNYVAFARFKPDGTVDSTFGTNGTAVDDSFEDSSDYLAHGGSRITLQPDGRIILAGGVTVGEGQDMFKVSTARYLANGKPDRSYGEGGITVSTTHGTAYAAAVQKDGKIVAAGNNGDTRTNLSKFHLERFNPDGSYDKAFGVKGVVDTKIGTGGSFINDVAIQEDGKIVVTGNAPIFTVARYNTDGSLDQSFGVGGIMATTFTQYSKADRIFITGEKKDKIVATGSISDNTTGIGDFVAAAYNSDGSLDPEFGNGGIAITDLDIHDYSYSADLQTDGKIVQFGNTFSTESAKEHRAFTRYYGYPQKVPLAIRIRRWLHNHGISWKGLPAEDKVAYYTVEQSANGTSGFTPVAKVSGVANLKDYSITNSRLLQGNNYYRIKAVSTDGVIRYSEVVSADNTANTASIFPNPAKNYVTVQGLAANETANISIKDGSGNVLARVVSTGSTQYRSQLGSNMQPGTYYLNITTGSKTEVLKFVKE